MTRSLQPERAWVLVRNRQFRQWSAQAQPDGYPDRIILRLGVAPGAAVDAVEQGRADVLFSSPPVSRIHELATRYANLLHTYPLGATFALFLDTRVKPFSVLAARQAINYAIDRNTMIQLGGGPLAAQPTCQILPPTLPGYQPYCPYTINPGPSGAWQAPDLARAEQLVRQSGTLGDKVTVVTDPMQATMPGPAAGSYLVSVLRQIGYRASLRAIASRKPTGIRSAIHATRFRSASSGGLRITPPPGTSSGRCSAATPSSRAIPPTVGYLSPQGS